MKEIWKDVKGYEGLYEISSYGRVKRLPRLSKKGSNLKEKILTINGKSQGYPVLGLVDEGYNNNFHSLHRLMAKAFISNPDNKPHVNHINKDRADYNIGNLEWCTHKENMRHAFTNITAEEQGGFDTDDEFNAEITKRENEKRRKENRHREKEMNENGFILGENGEFFTSLKLNKNYIISFENDSIKITNKEGVAK